MQVIAKSTLKKFCERPAYQDARGPLESWYEEAAKACWTSPQAIKNQFRNVSTCGQNRAIFSIGGNKYRLVIEVQYQAQIIWVKFIGTHKQYDKINVEEINQY